MVVYVATTINLDMTLCTHVPIALKYVCYWDIVLLLVFNRGSDLSILLLLVLTRVYITL